MTGYLDANLAGLESIYPWLGRWLHSLPPAVPPQDDLSSSGMTPTEYAARQLEQRWLPDIELHVVDRFASTPLAKFLFDRLNLAELHEERNRRLLLLEDRPEILRWALEREDWRTLILSECCLFAVDQPERNVLSRLLHRYPFISHASFQVYAGDVSGTDERIASVVQILSQVREQTARSLGEQIRQVQPHKKPPYPNTFRFFVPGHNYLQDASVTALRKLGYDAERLKWKSPLYRFVSPTAWIKEYLISRMDAAVFLNSTPARFTRNDYLRRLPVRAVAWFVDNPRRYVHRAQDLEGCDLVGVFDPAYIPYLKSLTPVPVIEARTAYGIDPARSGTKPNFTGIDIAFVGELGTRGFLALEQGFQQLAPDRVAAANIFLKETDVTQPIFFSDVAEKWFAARGDGYHGNWVEFLENKATTLRRRYFLEALADRGLVVFGDDEWANSAFAGPLANCYAGKRLDYFTELPSLYASARININIFHAQCVAAPNPRVYDVLASGGFLLTQYNPGLEDEFEIGTDLDVFHTREELREKAEYYLAHEDERRRIARWGRERVLAKCGYGDRMQSFLTALSARAAGDAYVYLCR